MSEKQMKFLKKNSKITREQIEVYYRTKYFSLFMNGYEFSGLDSQQQRFLLTQFWEVGTINAFILKGSKPESIDIKGAESPNGVLVLTPYAPSEYNIYNFPTKVTPVRLRGATFIPTERMKVNEECVLGWAHVSHNSVRSIVESYIEKITDVEVTIRMNLATHKLPRLIVVNPEDKERMKALANSIEDGVPVLYVSVEDSQKINNIIEGGNYIIDKLFTYKQNLEKELMTIMGIDNVGIVKRERENLDETNANNEEIDNGGDCFIDEMKIFCDLVSQVLNYPLSVKEKSPRVEMMEYESDGEDTGEDTEEGEQA